jgi:hypothetical protein
MRFAKSSFNSRMGPGVISPGQGGCRGEVVTPVGGVRGPEKHRNHP